MNSHREGGKEFIHSPPPSPVISYKWTAVLSDDRWEQLFGRTQWPLSSLDFLNDWREQHENVVCMCVCLRMEVTLHFFLSFYCWSWRGYLYVHIVLGSWISKWKNFITAISFPCSRWYVDGLAFTGVNYNFPFLYIPVLLSFHCQPPKVLHLQDRLGGHVVLCGKKSHSRW